jgi:hypothetical protein
MHHNRFACLSRFPRWENLFMSGRCDGEVMLVVILGDALGLVDCLFRGLHALCWRQVLLCRHV